MKEYAQKFYSSTAWKACRDSYKKKAGGLCERCKAKGIVKPGEVVHHKQHITPANIPFLRYEFSNGQRAAVEYIRVSSSGSYTTATGSYGVYGYSINSSGTVTIRKRYNSTNTLTINDKFDVYVYKLTMPTGKTLFN